MQAGGFGCFFFGGGAPFDDFDGRNRGQSLLEKNGGVHSSCWWMVISFDEKLKIQSKFMIFDHVFSQEVGEAGAVFSRSCFPGAALYQKLELVRLSSGKKYGCWMLLEFSQMAWGYMSIFRKNDYDVWEFLWAKQDLNWWDFTILQLWEPAH